MQQHRASTHADRKSQFACTLLEELRKPTGLRSHCCNHLVHPQVQHRVWINLRPQLWRPKGKQITLCACTRLHSLAQDGVPAAEGNEADQASETNACFSWAKCGPLFPQLLEQFITSLVQWPLGCTAQGELQQSPPTQVEVTCQRWPSPPCSPEHGP